MSGKGTVLVTAGRASSAAGVSSSCCGQGYAVRTTLPKSRSRERNSRCHRQARGCTGSPGFLCRGTYSRCWVGTRPPAVQSAYTAQSDHYTVRILSRAVG